MIRTGLRPYRSDSVAGEEVGDGLGGAERQDEGQTGSGGVQTENLHGQRRKNRALLAEHAADQSVDGDEERELGEVGA